MRPYREYDMRRIMWSITGYPKTTITIVLLITVGFFVQIKKLRSETIVCVIWLHTFFHV